MSFNDTNNNLLNDGKLLGEHITSQLKLGKTEEEIVNYLVDKGAKKEKIAPFVRLVHFFNLDYIDEQYKLGKTAAEIIDDLVSKGVKEEDAVRFVARFFAMEEMGKSFTKTLETQERLKNYVERSDLAQKGYKRMWRGAIIFIIGSVITLLTYYNPVGNSYYICYGAMIFGAIDFLIGLSQWQGSRN